MKFEIQICCQGCRCPIENVDEDRILIFRNGAIVGCPVCEPLCRSRVTRNRAIVTENANATR